MKKLLVLAALALGMQSAVAATKMIGTVRLSEGNEFEFKDVQNVCGLRKIRLFVTNDNAHIEYVAVRFGNGEYQNINVREHFARDSWSNWKDLKGNTRCVSAFMVYGHSGSHPRDAQIHLIGK